MKKVFLCLLSALLIGCSSISVNAKENQPILIPPAVEYTISDATHIQRVLSGIDEVYEGRFDFYDVDRDGKLTVSDVTFIQKKLAGYQEIYVDLVDEDHPNEGWVI